MHGVMFILLLRSLTLVVLAALLKTVWYDPVKVWAMVLMRSLFLTKGSSMSKPTCCRGTAAIHCCSRWLIYPIVLRQA